MSEMKAYGNQLHKAVQIEKVTDCSEIIETLQQVQEQYDETYNPVLIGSRSLALNIPSRDVSKSDFDIIMTASQVLNIINENPDEYLVAYIIYDKQNIKYFHLLLPNEQIEISVCTQEGSSLDEILKLTHSDKIWHRACKTFPLGKSGLIKINFLAASLPILEMIKRSHIFFPRNWHKHIEDLHLIRSKLNKNFWSSHHPELKRLYELRFQETCERHGIPANHINLNMSNEDFLDRPEILWVKRYVKHDRIHDLVAYYDAPIYTRCKKDQSKAMMDKEMFFALDYLDQIRDVKEEAMVIALERFILPFGYGNILTKTFVQDAYLNALERVCTTLTKGWFSEFAVDVYPQARICDMDLLEIAQQIREEAKENETDVFVKELIEQPKVHLELILSYCKEDSKEEELNDLYYEMEDKLSNDEWVMAKELKPFIEIDDYKEVSDYYDDYDDYGYMRQRLTINVPNKEPLIVGFKSKHETSYRSDITNKGYLYIQLPKSEQSDLGPDYDCTPPRNLLKITHEITSYGGSSDGCEWSEEPTREENTSVYANAYDDHLATYNLTTDFLVKFVCCLLNPHIEGLENDALTSTNYSIHPWYSLWVNNL
jgi:hypothetical protein